MRFKVVFWNPNCFSVNDVKQSVFHQFGVKRI